MGVVKLPSTLGLGPPKQVSINCLSGVGASMGGLPSILEV